MIDPFEAIIFVLDPAAVISFGAQMHDHVGYHEKKRNQPADQKEFKEIFDSLERVHHQLMQVQRLADHPEIIAESTETVE